jgi:hypothetical protein
LPFFEALSGFGIGYLFVLAAQSQILRIAKNVRDEADASEFRSSFETIEHGITQLRKKGLSPAPEDLKFVPTNEPSKWRRVDVSLQFHEAMLYLKEGWDRSAIALAAVAFEAAIRQAADRLGADVDKSLTRLIRDLCEGRLCDEKLLELDALVEIRNDIVRLRGDFPLDGSRKASELFSRFRNGADLVLQLLPPDPPITNL